MKEAAGVGKIVKGVNTTPDVQPGETERQAKKLFPMNKGGKPKSLGVKGATPNVAFNLGLTEDEMTTIERAEQFAQEAHKDHKRKYTGDPYYVHLDEVRRIVKAAGGSEDMQAAALLHDTVEDTSTTSQDIMQEFGPRIARLVIDLTDISKPEDGNRATRKAMDRDKLAMASAEAQTIKYADLISNGKDIAKNDPKFAKVYHAEKADLLRVMRKGDQNLRKAAIDMLPDDLRSIAMENMSVTGTERRRLERKKGIKVGTPEWFKHWFDLPYLRDDVTPETKEAPPGTYFTKSGNLVKGTLTKSAKDKGARQTDPKDNQRSKVPAVTQYNEGKRVARKKGQKANSKKHSDLYTDENPKGTIHGLKFATVKDAEASVTKIKGSGKKHAHKIQAAIAMEQRAKAAGKKSAAAVYRRYINAMKKKTKKMNESTIQKVDIQQLEKFADKLFGKVGIDVEFTRHFMDRVNDVRNQKPITMSELTRLFKQEYKRWGRPIAQLGPDSEAVMKDLQTDINLPFVLKWDSKNNELDLVAKTVMRKADFKTSNKEFPVEDTNLNEVINKDFLKTTIADIAGTLGIDVSTAMALAQQESGFRQNVVGDKTRKNKAYGLFQVRLPALKDVNRLYKTNYTIDDVANDPKINTEVGLRYYQAQKDFYGAKNDAQAFRGYNGGPGAIKGTIKGANKYSQSVQATKKSFDKEYADLNAPRYYDKIDNPQTITAPVPKPVLPNIDQKPVIKQPTPKPTKVNYNQLAKASGIADPNKIFPGQTINLPTGATYTVKSGDTLGKIAQNYNKGLIGENVPSTNQAGTIGQHINWAGKNKPKQTKKIATRGTQDPQNWWQSMLQKGKNLFDDEQLDLKKKFEITDELRQLDSIFKKGKYSIRIVGGAVRDLALGKTPKDIDLATDATPQEMQSMFDSAGIKHIPTGIEHGTITAVINSEPYEITTLRADVETDGRRAEVEFVRSWEEDAKRRDLTYNAMSMDFEGNLYDYHGGMDDLQDKVTRFVGDPEERIKEDYLRTLRYFRFQGRLDTPTFDRETMSAIANNTDGLKQLSVERVWMEMGKILSGSNIQQILGAMQKTGVLNAIGLSAKPSQELMDGGDPIINLARITDDQSIGPRWKMSNEEKGKLGFLISQKGQTHDKKWYTDQMVDGFDRTQLDALARYKNQDDMIQYIKTFKAPEFPVDGNDLIKIGHERGPGIGKTLMALRNKWKAGNFKATKDDLLGEDQEFNELDYVLKKQVKPSQAVMLTKLGKFHNGADELEQFVPERKGKQYALHPNNWKGTYYSLTNKDTTKIGYYRPKIVTPPAGSMVADMAIANKFYRTKDEDEKQQLAQAYKDSMVEYGADISHIKFPEILMPSVNENFADGKKPGRKGLSKRVGIPKGATLAQLEKIAKNSTGERRRMAQWQLNMRRGKNKSK